MKMNKETKISIIECNIESIKMNDKYGLITIDSEIFDLGLKTLEDQERYEDCCILRDNKDLLINGSVVSVEEKSPYIKLLKAIILE